MRASNQKKVFLFDLDHTLIRGNISFLFGRYLYKKGMISILSAYTVALFYMLYKMHFIPLSLLHRVSLRLLLYKMPKTQLKELVQSFLDEEFEQHIREDMIQELQHLKKGGDLLLYSSSPDFLVIPIGLRLNALHSIGTNYLFDDQGLLQTVGKVVDGNQKVIYLKNYLTTMGMGMQAVAAYSDSVDDLPVLEQVGEPIAVYPEKKLEKIARKNLWKIVKKSNA